MFAPYYYVEDNTVDWHPMEYHLAANVDEILEAIRRMDGISRTIVIITERIPKDEDPYPYAGRMVTIGGGKDNMYLVGADLVESGNPLDAYSRVRPSSDEWVEVVWGQPGTYPPACIIPLNDVETIARTFVETGILDGVVDWWH